MRIGRRSGRMRFMALRRSSHGPGSGLRRSDVRRAGPVVADRVARVGTRDGSESAEGREDDDDDRENEQKVHLISLVMDTILTPYWLSDKVRSDATIEDQFRRRAARRAPA